MKINFTNNLAFGLAFLTLGLIYLPLGPFYRLEAVIEGAAPLIFLAIAAKFLAEYRDKN